MSDLFYRAVIQEILLFVSESWVMLEAMTRTVERNHVGLLHNIMGKRVIQKDDGSWEIPAAEEVLGATGIQSESICIGQRQVTVSQWVYLPPLLEVCVQKTGYGGGGMKRRTQQRHGATGEALRTTLEEALRVV